MTMKKYLILSAVGLSCLMAACGGSDKEVQADTVFTIPDLASGVYTVSTGSESDAVVGKYTAAQDGSRLLYFWDASEKVKTMLSRADGKAAWKLIYGKPESSSLTFTTSSAKPSALLDPGSASGSYQMRLANGDVVEFVIDEAGGLQSAAGTVASCKLQGSASATPLPNMLKMKISAGTCAALGPDWSGVLVLDSDQKPAAYRLLSTDATTLRDYWVYRN